MLTATQKKKKQLSTEACLYVTLTIAVVVIILLEPGLDYAVGSNEVPKCQDFQSERGPLEDVDCGNTPLATRLCRALGGNATTILDVLNVGACSDHLAFTMAGRHHVRNPLGSDRLRWDIN
jgi:hypothetical protein